MASEKTKNKLSFTHIMLILLCIGTFAVAGLIYLLYQQIIITPETTAANYRREQAASSPVELMSPSGKPVSAQRVIKVAAASAADAHMVQAASDADIAPMIALSAPRKANNPRKTTPPKAAANKEQPASEEVILQPTNVPAPAPAVVREKPSTPIAAREKPSSNTSTAETTTRRERDTAAKPRVLTPNPERNHSDATNALFE